jgi:dTDP-4-dehydrorhamnose reductase
LKGKKMKAVITGANGTIGSKLKSHLEEQGHTVVGWNRQEVPINDYWAMENFLKAESPDVVYHLAIPSNPTGHENESWMVNYQWTSELAWISKVLGISFIFSSTVMVFTNNAKGPFRPDMSPDAVEGYGYEKRMAEERVFYQNPGARIVRLGWQIGDAPGSNNMVDFFGHQDEKRRLGFCQYRMATGLLLFGGHRPGPGSAPRYGPWTLPF